jgi:hypothetical protein
LELDKWINTIATDGKESLLGVLLIVL